MKNSQRHPWWLRLKQAAKNVRNDWNLQHYLRLSSENLGLFLENLGSRLSERSGPRNLLCIVAFEQPAVLDLCLTALRLHIRNAQVVIFDNSRSEGQRSLVFNVCEAHEVPYLALPPQKTRHANRSHGLAMTWIYQKVLRELPLDGFGFIDHDLIALGTVDPYEPLANQPVYGALNQGYGAWNLWAGYCFFRSDYVLGRDVNFLYDFSKELDTGGRNWMSLYEPLRNQMLEFAEDEIITQEVIPGIEQPVQVVNRVWLHVGGVSYNGNLHEKWSLFQALVEHIKQLEAKSDQASLS
jgi:hypothetical protein